MSSAGKKVLSILLTLMMAMSTIICMFGGLIVSAAEEPISDIYSGWTWPLAQSYTNITSGFGYRASMGDYHQGIDISSSGIEGQPIYAARKGTVVYVGVYYNCGNMVSIRHGTYNGATIYTTYMHMKYQACVSVGQEVDPSTVIGYVGGTGTNGTVEYGVHLHFQICKNDKNPAHSNNDQLYANYYNPSNVSYSYSHIKDTTPPTISSAYATQIDGDGYTAVAIFDDNVGVTRARFATWTAENGQDDLIWVDGYIEAGGKSAYVRIRFADHNNEPGVYITHAYAYDAAGNYTSKEISFVRDTTPPSITEYGIIETDSSGFTAYCCFADNADVSRVRFPTWTPWQGDNNGQDDLIWYEGNFNPDGKSAWARVLFSEHNNELGAYVTHIYVYDTAGNCSQVAMGIVAEKEAPVISNVTISDITTTGYTVSCTVTDQNAIDRVQFPSWHTWDDLKWLNGTVSGSTATCRVNINDFNSLTGTYQTHIYAYDIWGNVCSVNAGYVYVPSPSELYTVTYDSNGGSGAPSPDSDYVNVELSNTEPIRNGYTFLGWSTGSNATTAQYQPGETISPGQNITLYAVWEQIPVASYVLTYDANGGNNPPENQTGNGAVTLSSLQPSRDGYTFQSWNTRSDGEGTNYFSEASFSLNEDTTLYAIWLKDFNPECPNNPDNSLNHVESDPVIENATVSTCIEAGEYDEVVYCIYCGEELSREHKIKEAGIHISLNAVAENEIAPSCIANGSYDSVIYCGICDMELSREQLTYDALGHSDTDADGKCDRCGEEFIKNFTVSDTKVLRGKSLDWTVTTLDTVDTIRLRGTYTTEDGTKKTLTYIYKDNQEISNLRVTDEEGIRTWNIKMPFTFSTSFDDLKINETWSLSYKNDGLTKWNDFSETKAISVFREECYMNENTSEFEPFTLVSVTGPENVQLNKFSEITIVTTSDCAKVRISVNGKNATYMKSSTNVTVTENEDGTTTWVIRYKFTQAGENTYSVSTRGPAWSEAKTFITTVV